jgi:hypothetical protein
MSEIRPDEFFELIWGRAPEGGWVTLATFPGAGKFRQGAGPTREAWFQWPQQKEDLLATVGQYQDADLYFSPMVYKSRAHYKTDPQTKNRIRTGGRRKDNAIWVGSVSSPMRMPMTGATLEVGMSHSFFVCRPQRTTSAHRTRCRLGPVVRSTR